MRLTLDAMGGDHAPAAAIEGGVQFAREHLAHELILVGDEKTIRGHLARVGSVPNLTVHHASEVVDMGDHAATSIRRKRDSSLRVCFELVKRGRADAVVSAGHSGAMLAGALLVLGRIEHVERPAIATLLPALKGGGSCLLLDAGANVDCKPSQLAQFGVMGEVYVRRLLKVARPKVALLSNGEEDSKGTQLTRDALEILRKSDLDFVGYCEGKDIFSGDLDVVVTDGFTGNVVLKTTEGAAMGVTGLIRTAIEKAGLPTKVGALLLKPTFAGLKKAIDYAEYGGAPLLGIDGVGIVAHGRSSPKAIKNALRAALQTAEAQLREGLTEAIARSLAWNPAKVSKASAARPEGKGTTGEPLSD